jgi:hypothetical protein
LSASSFYLQILPVQPKPSQVFDVTLGTQNCEMTLQQMSTGMFMSISVDGVSVISGRYCVDRVNMVRQKYLGFGGALYFVDTTQQGSDPYYSGLGSRYLLVYEWDLP